MKCLNKVLTIIGCITAIVAVVAAAFAVFSYFDKKKQAQSWRSTSKGPSSKPMRIKDRAVRFSDQTAFLFSGACTG